MKRCVIVGGADIEKYEIIKSYFDDNDFFIYCDSGIKHLEYLNREPQLIVGDFDSHENPHMDVETIVLPCEKDDTDTVFAVGEAFKRGFDDFLLIGVIGARLDHTLGNVSILAYLDSLCVTGKIIDDYSEMEIVNNNIKYIDNSFAYFSLLNIFGEVIGVNIRNAKYSIEDAIITCNYQYGISNEPLENKTAEVEVKEGRLLLVKIRK